MWKPLWFDPFLLIDRLGKLVSETSLVITRFGPDYIVQFSLMYLNQHVNMKRTALRLETTRLRLATIAWQLETTAVATRNHSVITRNHSSCDSQPQRDKPRPPGCDSRPPGCDWAVHLGYWAIMCLIWATCWLDYVLLFACVNVRVGPITHCLILCMLRVS